MSCYLIYLLTLQSLCPLGPLLELMDPVKLPLDLHAQLLAPDSQLSVDKCGLRFGMRKVQLHLMKVGDDMCEAALRGII